MSLITRFAPSPTGRLHIGHALSALFGFKQARDSGGKFILRIEDIDETRSRPEFEAGIFEDLEWLGIEWEKPVRRQSEHMPTYKDALRVLTDLDLIYPCFCTRKEIEEEITRSVSAPHGPEGALYPGTCKHLSEDEQLTLIAEGKAYAFRLNMDKAISYLEAKNKWPLYWEDIGKGEFRATPQILGDVILARKDVSASYHLCVTVDDNLQNVNCVTRGEDLFYASHLHRILQEILGYNVPRWHHHGLLLDAEGKRFAKRNNAVTLKHMREIDKLTPSDIMKIVGIKICLLFSLLLFPAPAGAQENMKDINPRQERIYNSIRSQQEKKFISFSFENDMIGKGTDRHYTNGVRLSYLNTHQKTPEFLKRLAELSPHFDVTDTSAFYWNIGQNLYSPGDISIATNQDQDRPWAAWLYGAAGIVTYNKKYADEMELTLGVVGPAALGEQTQKAVHKIRNIQMPKGWSHQIKNEPGVIVSWRRRWPAYWAQDLGALNFSVEPQVNASLGNIYTYAGSGITLRLSPHNIGVQDNPPIVRPAMPGTGYFEASDNLGWYLFAGLEGRAIARNIFLDGNSFTDSHSVDKKHFVADATAGLALTYDNYRLSYTAVYRTKEFDKQKGTDWYGSVVLSIQY
jgi:glutamyl-Q tRNA(Asp) synthetase